MPAVVVAHAVARGLDGVLRRRSPTLRAPRLRVGQQVVVPVDVEVVVLLHEREALVQPLGQPALAAPQLHATPVEPYVSVFVLDQVVSVVAVHKFLFE